MIDPGSLAQAQDFNPRSRKGSDRVLGVLQQVRADFNPRSRKGSDCCHGSDHSGADYFNPRSRKGSDKLAMAFSRISLTFQSTLP